jgi:hypothetical protein
MLVWNSMQVSSTAQRSALPGPPLETDSSSAGPSCGKNLLATDLSASDGHTLNQSMVVQLTNDGNLQAVNHQCIYWVTFC